MKKSIEKGTDESVRAYLLAREPEIKAAAGRRHIGAGLGFRQHHKLASKEELQKLRDGEDSRLLRALIFNGKHPAYQ
jgi:hypothetical protein